MKKLFGFMYKLFTLSLIHKVGIGAFCILLVWAVIARMTPGTVQNQVQTAQAQTGTLIITVSASGQVATANSASVTTNASGVVKTIYVKNGDLVKTGDKIAEIDLDLEGRQRSSQSYASYQNAKSSLESANAALYSTQSTMLTKWKTFMDLAQSSSYQNSDLSPRLDQRGLAQFVSPQDDWLGSEALYKNQQNIVAAAQTTLSSTWMSYQKSSPVIYSPISGDVVGLSLQKGTVINTTSNTSGTLVSQKIASIKTSAPPTIQVNLSEIDVTKVHIGDKSTLTLDAFPGKTFTGHVISIDSTGATNSGVITYPAVIKLDLDVEGMFSNMSANANIIIQTKSDVLLVPNSAIQSLAEGKSVRIMKNGKPQSVGVEIGVSSGGQTEIVAGLAPGDEVVTSMNPVQRTSTQTGSVFSALGGRGGVGGGTFRGLR